MYRSQSPEKVHHNTSTLKKNKPHLVVLGGGFGGVHTIKSLPRLIKQQIDITLIDQNDHFLFTPLLAEVAGSSLKKTDVSISFDELFGSSINFVHDTVDEINIHQKTVTLEKNKPISYDFLVSSLGAQSFFFGTPGALEYAQVFKIRRDAEKIRKHCGDVFKQAGQLVDKEARRKLLSFMVIGAGPTGVELTAELSDLMHHLLLPKYPAIHPDDISITLVNAGNRILEMFDESLSTYAQQLLLHQGIFIQNNVRVSEIKPNSVITNEGKEIFADTIIWTAGVTPINLNCSCGTFKKERGRVYIESDLSIVDEPETFVIGDMSLFPTDDNRGLPMTAQVARQQGIHVAKNITALIKGKKTTPFIYQEKGILASLGSYSAIGQVFGIKLKGIVAWVLWRGVYLGLFNSWKKRYAIVRQWFRNFIFGRILHK